LSDCDTAARFGWPIRVYIEDTDAGGVVFHARYLHFMERARTEWVRSCGIGLRAGMADNISYVVQRLSIHYAAPARLDDELIVTAEPLAFGRVWMEFRQRVVRVQDRKKLCEADVKVACIALDSGRPIRLPENIRGLLEQSRPHPETENGTIQE
jgi:4-hydroxybenzoyl-CoA thioesterase